MVLLLAVTSNIFGAVFARLGTAGWITDSLLALPLPPVAMLLLVILLIFLLGWPFEWPAIILVFLPIFYPVVAALKFDMLWFGALVAVVLQTAFLSPPVAMSAYYLRQVVKEWSLATIYRGMFEFMVLQVIAITIVIAVPSVALWFPEYLREQSKLIQIEGLDESPQRVGDDPLEAPPPADGEASDSGATTTGPQGAPVDELERDDFGKGGAKP
jgi:TRAP-type mannitol/chloroaromatic compound transport system permease large subunit